MVLMPDGAGHIPVLETEMMSFANLHGIEEPRILDGTFGRGGHLKKLAFEYPKAHFIAVDRDPEAIAYGRQDPELNVQNISFLQASFSNKELILDLARSEWGTDQFHLILLDLGVSSPQLDTPRRGFSFYNEGPLDMRMNPDEG